MYVADDALILLDSLSCREGDRHIHTFANMPVAGAIFDVGTDAISRDAVY